jgi:hypothetical protein
MFILLAFGAVEKTPVVTPDLEHAIIETIKKNPTIIEDALRIAEINRQEKMRDQIEEIVEKDRNAYFTHGISHGDAKIPAQFVVFLDPLDRVSQEFAKVLKELKNVSIRIYIVPFSCPTANEQEKYITFSKLAIAASCQSVEKMLQFIAGLDDVGDVKGAQFSKQVEGFAKKAGLNSSKLLKDLMGADIAAKLQKNIELGQKCGAPLPLLFGLHTDQKVSLLPPVSVEDFDKLIQLTKETKEKAREIAAKYTEQMSKS